MEVGLVDLFLPCAAISASLTVEIRDPARVLRREGVVLISVEESMSYYR